jgi:hypothetical protein
MDEIIQLNIEISNGFMIREYGPEHESIQQETEPGHKAKVKWKAPWYKKIFCINCLLYLSLLCTNKILF